MDPGTVDIYPSSRIPKNLHYLVKPIYCSKSLITKDLSGSGDTLKEKGFRITTNPQTLTSVLQFSSDDEVRKMVYIRGNSVPHANVDVLKRLISARHELAQIMGSRSYAEFSVKPNMAVSPKVVTSFLLEMSKMVQAKSIEERKLVMKFKREKCGRSDGDLRPWDETYYMTMMKSSSYKLDASVVGSYFSLSNCIEGLKVLVQSLFGATFRIIPLAPGESWDPHVLKLSLDHPEEKNTDSPRRTSDPDNIQVAAVAPPPTHDDNGSTLGSSNLDIGCCSTDNGGHDPLPGGSKEDHYPTGTACTQRVLLSAQAKFKIPCPEKTSQNCVSLLTPDPHINQWPLLENGQNQSAGMRTPVDSYSPLHERGNCCVKETVAFKGKEICLLTKSRDQQRSDKVGPISAIHTPTSLPAHHPVTFLEGNTNPNTSSPPHTSKQHSCATRPHALTPQKPLPHQTPTPNDPEAENNSGPGDLGYLYLDLYSRKGKYPGCAHFAIKGARRISQTEYQLPKLGPKAWLTCAFGGNQTFTQEGHTSDVDREDQGEGCQVDGGRRDEAVEVVGDAVSDEEEERSNKNGNSGEERGSHPKEKF
ncbi:hypothetical protein JHK85_010023 [Glycine max]|nr:hypothetical protein JHK85_010023 [Glycine max]